jgi:hypothetical protein
VETNQEVQSDSVPFGEQSLDQHLQAEQQQVAELNASDEEAKKVEEPVTENAPEGDAGDDNDEVEGEGVSGEVDEGVEAAGEYTPNTKYKVLDKEYEFDPKLQAVLTPETEPLIRELYEKAQGLPTIKEKLASTRQDLDQVGGQFNQLFTNVQRIMGHAEQGDLDSFFEEIGMSTDQVAKWMLEKARIASLPEDQQMLYNERQLLKKRMAATESGTQQAISRQQQEVVNARVQLLDINLASPDRQPIVADFDSRNGEGAFKKAVMNFAAQTWHSEKKDLSPKEAVEQFCKTMGLTAPAKASSPKPGDSNGTKRVVAKPKAKPTIPNYGSGQASVTAEKKPKNLDELRKYTKQKYG